MPGSRWPPVAGARPFDRDDVDRRVVRDVARRAGRILDGQAEVGGWSEAAPTWRPVALPSDPHGDLDEDGYTHVEEWLHRLAADLTGMACA